MKKIKSIHYLETTMSDNYEFEKSMRPQDIDEYSPYMDKQYNNYINDMNSQSYANTSLSLVQFDLGQIYNSQKFTDPTDMFLVIPITMVAAFNNSGTIEVPGPGNVNLLSLKTNFIHLLHQADVSINGKTIETMQPYINVAKHFQMLSEMSYNDLVTIGPTLGFGETIDNPCSAVWNANSTTANGNGFTNNKVFVPNAVSGTSVVSAGHRYQTTLSTQQNKNTINDGITSRLSRYADCSTGGAYNNIVPNLVTIQQLKNELRPSYEVSAGGYMIWYDYAVIKLSSIFECLANAGLVRKFDCMVRFWINTGTVNVTVSNPNSATPGYSLTTANNSFTNTCPFTINYLCDTGANGGITAGTNSFVAGCYIGKPPTTTFNGVN